MRLCKGNARCKRCEQKRSSPRPLPDEPEEPGWGPLGWATEKRQAESREVAVEGGGFARGVWIGAGSAAALMPRGRYRASLGMLGRGIGHALGEGRE